MMNNEQLKSGWTPEMSLEDTKNLAYWERNMMALFCCSLLEMLHACFGRKDEGHSTGWYYHNEYEGWSRVISMCNGKITFHVPDDFDLGTLKEIEPNWNGHTTKEKWEFIESFIGIK